MSLLALRPLGTATPAPAPAQTYPDVPTIHARIAWRDEGFTTLTDTDPVATGGTVSATSSDSFGGGSSWEMSSAGSATLSFAGGTVTADRAYRFRVALRSVSGETAAVLAASTATGGTVTMTTGWAWHTFDWTPTATGLATATVTVGTAAVYRADHAEMYEYIDEVVPDYLRVTRGARFDGGTERPGTIELRLPDADATYTPLNSASSLYGLVGPGRQVFIRAERDGRLFPLAFGVVRGVEPDPDTKTTRFECEDGLSLLEEYSIERAFDTEQAYHTVRQAAITAEALGTASLDLATDSTESDICIDGTDYEDNLLDYLEDLNEATGSVHWCAPTVDAHAPWKYTTRSRATLTAAGTDHVIDDDFQALRDVASRDESLITRQRVTWVGYDPLPSQVVVEATQKLPYWTYRDDEFGSSDTPNPETVYAFRRVWRVQRGTHKKGKKEVKWKRRRKVRRLRRVGKVWRDNVVPIVIAAGGTAVRTVDFQMPMQDFSVAVTDGGNVTTTLTEEPARLTITMMASSADTVTDIVVSARPRRPTDEYEEESDTGAASVREGAEINNEHIGSRALAEGLGDYLTWRYGEGRLRPEVRLRHRPITQENVDIADRVRLTADRWYISSAPMVVRTVEHEFDEGGLLWDTTVGLEELPSGDRAWFTLDSSVLDGTDTLAY